MQNNIINWFEIPVTDMRRASGFYSTVLGQTLRFEQIAGNELAVFAYQPPGVGGCLIHGQRYLPSDNGVVIYLNITQGMDRTLDRIESAGGRVLTGKTQLPGDMGCYAHILDTEGNRVGLHAHN
ncbi:MAG: VOC family protein [Steroidobacteraceae bacterium]